MKFTGRVAAALAVSYASLVAAEDTIIPLVCHTGVQLIGVPGANVGNGTHSYGLGANFVNTLMANIPDSDDISLNYNRSHLPANAGKVFVAEVQQGMPALLALLQNYTKACPTTPIVLHGYSEGAVVVTNLLCGASSGSFITTSPLDSSYAKQIISVVTYGDETYTAGQTYNLPTQPVNGVDYYCPYDAPHLPRRTPAGCAAFAPAMQAYCFKDDDDCCLYANTSNPNGPTGAPWHWQYPGLFDTTAVTKIITQYNAYMAALPKSSSSSTSSATSTTSTSSSVATTLATSTKTSTSTSAAVTALSTGLPSGIIALGCYTDGWTRSLPVALYSNNSNTPALCAAGCKSAGYAYSGTEYGVECWCGPSLSSSLVATASDCNVACAGASAQTCGGSWRLSVTQDTSLVPVVTAALPSGFASLGCYTDGWSRTLSYAAFNNNNNSQSVCATQCRTLGYIYSGTEYGAECWCGNIPPPSSYVADDSTSCNVACAGNSLQTCGGSWRLSVVKDTALTLASAGFSTLGCFTDSYTRVFPTRLYQDSGNTNIRCALGCRAAGYQYSGTEYQSECYCSGAAPLLKADAGYCNAACSGNSSEICGGGWGLLTQQDLNYKA